MNKRLYERDKRNKKKVLEEEYYIREIAYF